jgi:hypothetical protein
MQVLVTGQDKLYIGAAERVDDLAVYPVFAKEQRDIGRVLALHEALETGAAEVRELGSGEDEPGTAIVGKLAIENKGDLPVYVLAGTVVKGGNQDRQVAQDFVVAPRSTVPVDAFCVEQGRWNGERDSVATHGKFSSSTQLATAKVRAAGQHESDQGAVWAEVAKVNAKAGKHASSGSLFASLDDAEIAQRRSALAERIKTRLAALEPQGSLVGFGYAVGGQVKGVRWFASHQLYETFRDVLLNTAATDALTAPAGPKTPPPAASSLVDFVAEVERAPAEERATPGENDNAYKRGKSGYGSTTTLRARSGKKPVPVSKDYLSK